MCVTDKNGELILDKSFSWHPKIRDAHMGGGGGVLCQKNTPLHTRDPRGIYICNLELGIGGCEMKLILVIGILS